MTGDFKTPKELFDWMTTHVKYDHGSDWKLRSPYEVLMYGKGDCHDQTIFEYHYFKSMWHGKYRHRVFFMITPDGRATHSFLAFYAGNNYWWFENAWAKYKGIRGPYKNMTELKKDVLTKWCKQYKSDPDNTYIGKLRYMTPGASMEDFCKKNVK